MSPETPPIWSKAVNGILSDLRPDTVTAVMTPSHKFAEDGSQTVVDLPASAESTRETRPIIFFDGVCGLCNWFVDFVIRRDQEGRFLFAPLQGVTAREKLTDDDTRDLSTVVLLDEAGTHRRSKAVVRILMKMNIGWRIAGIFLVIVPPPIRDIGYRLVSRFRYQMFGKKETCRIPSAQERTRFLP
ncbi:MAG: thiol-disulfide oxidoreductase DCC family protein [Planctomycetaceae bacterium]